MASAKEAAAHVFLTPARLRVLQQGGHVKRYARGQYDVNAIRKDYIDYLRRRAVGRPGAHQTGDNSQAELTELKIRADRAKAERSETENRVRMGTLIPIDEQIEIGREVVNSVQRQVMASGTRIAALTIGLKTEREIGAVCDDEHREALRGAAAILRSLS